MNERLDRLQAYPFERMRAEFGALLPLPESGINLSIGEPKHAPPSFVQEILNDGLRSLATYPPTQGPASLRQAIASWIGQRFGVQLDPETEVLPVLGSREALFAIAQVVVSPGRKVICPNPFYQIYEGAALLAGAEPVFLNLDATHGFAPHWESITDETWAQTDLVYLCSPHNPTGRITSAGEVQMLLAMAARHDFVIAADECYSEISTGDRPDGILQSAMRVQGSLDRVIVFNSLSKRSSLPGLRSGFVVGDRDLLRKFLLYRTYHGSAMSELVARVSEAAWRDEAHADENRRRYQAKVAKAQEILPNCPVPEGGFFLWLPVPGGDDVAFAKNLVQTKQVLVLPGRYLGRENNGTNPGAGFVRVALVPDEATCEEGLRRIAELL
ncbi:MAG: succinyldiaminopimelate transaminase [Chthonomonas sp.]|nr:succinyldiaminopimelate transaminase [Chthonomonas sp.]